MKLNKYIYALHLSGVVILCSGNEPKQKANNEPIVTYTIRMPTQVHRGKSFQIDVLFTVQPKWYIYAPDGTNAAQGMIETKVFFNSSKEILRVGKIRIPDPIFKDGHRVYEGNNIIMSQTFDTGTLVKPGKYEITGKVIYQTCNSEICLPPESEEIRMTIEIR